MPLRHFPPGRPRRRLVEAFLTPQTRLLVAEGDLTEVREGARVRVAHEALLTHWGRAREQLMRDRADLQLRARLEQAAGLWQAAPAAGRDSLLLRSGLPLAEAKDLLQRQSNELDEAVITYIEASAAAVRARGRRQLRRLQATVALFAVLAVLAGLAAWFALAQQRVAQAQLEQALRNESRYLVREAQAAMRDGNGELAERLSLQALPSDLDRPDRPLVLEAVLALSQAITSDPLRVVLAGHKGQVTAAAFSLAGDRVVTAADGTARLWDAATGALLATLRQDGRVAVAAFSPAGDRVVTAASDGTARLWEAATGALLATLQGHQGPVGSAAFSPAGDRIVTAAFDRTVRLWDATTGALLATFRGHQGPVVSVAFNRTGDLIVTGSWDGTARVWEAATGAALATFQHEAPVWSAAFNPAGDRVVTAAGIMGRLWDTSFLIANGDRPTTGDLISYAQAAAVRPLAAVKRSELSPPEEEDPAGAGRETTGSAALAGPGLDRCDALAANPSDPQRVGPGVPSSRLEADAAVPACRAAVAAAPGAPRPLYLYQLGRLLAGTQHAAEALQYLQAAADRGYAMALNDLGTLYRDGSGIARDLSAAAARLYRQAGDRGVAEADRHLAELAWNGDGLPENRPEALRLFTRAAERGDPWSHQRLAELYERGDGVARDLAAALVHHAAAAQQFAALGAAEEAAFETARRGSLARTLPLPEVARLWRELRAQPPAAPR